MSFLFSKKLLPNTSNENTKFDISATVNIPETTFQSIGLASKDYHGDDAVGYGTNYIMVADGVSGTLDSSGFLASTLQGYLSLEMQVVEYKFKNRYQYRSLKKKRKVFLKHVKRSMDKAIQKCVSHNSLDCTLSVVCFDHATKHAFICNIGDSKCIFIRKNEMVYESASTVYDFNVPAVVTSKRGYNKGDIVLDTFKYEADDICMCFSDGISDNLYFDDLYSCIHGSQKSKNYCKEMALNIVSKAMDAIQNKDIFVPFSLEALKALESRNRKLVGKESVDKLKKEMNVYLKKKRITREVQGHVKLNYYSIESLLSFALRKSGKPDDISICIGHLK